MHDGEIASPSSKIGPIGPIFGLATAEPGNDNAARLNTASTARWLAPLRSWQIDRVWLGALDYASAVRTGRLVFDGPPRLAREFPSWFLWSPMARFVRADRERQSATAQR